MSAILSVKVERKPQVQDRNRVIWVPRHIAEHVLPGTNLISIEYFENDRPMFRMGVNVYPILGDREVGEIGLDQWIEELNGADIVVHCEMGMVRSRAMARYIVENFGYTEMNHLTLFDSEDEPFIFKPYRPHR